MMVRLAILTGVVALMAGPLGAQSPRAIGIDEFITTPVVSDPQPSPSGRTVAFTVTTASLEENRGLSKIWIADLPAGEARPFTAGEGNERTPRWAPDGGSLTFLSTRGGSAQLWRAPAGGGEPVQRIIAVREFGAGAKHFEHIEDLKNALEEELDAETTVLVKGSRFMKMERMVEFCASTQEAQCCSH
mgnify:CR=1 FL=1